MTVDQTPDAEEPTPRRRTRAEQIRDLIMMVILTIWITYAIAAVIQLFRDGSQVLESLPPFWFWGIPLAPFSALYAPWGSAVRAIVPGTPPPPPEPPTGTGGGPQ